MSMRATAPLMLIALIASAQDIHLKTRTIVTGSNPGMSGTLRNGQRHEHLIVQFDHPPGIDDLDSLAEDATVVSALPDNAVVVSARAARLAKRGEIHSNIQWIGAIQAADKISPAFSAGTDPQPKALVEFHSDVSRARQDELLRQFGFAWDRPAVLLPNHILLEAPMGLLRKLAEEDEVAYVFPADPDLSFGTSLSACAGMLTMSGAVAQYSNIIHGWDLDVDHTAHLSYVFGSLTPKVPTATVQAEILRAMNEWSRNASVVFQPGTTATAPRTILIRFISGAHGDSYGFDGPGGSLAHTFYPVPVNPESIAGDVHLDADENWHAGGDLDIYSVVLHELGHAIGLGHSDKPGDVMYPYYRRGALLSANDIGAARSLYGAPPGAVTTSPTPPTPVTSVAPLRLTVDPVTYASISGTVAGGEAPWSVQWQSDQGYTGKAVVTSSGTWTVPGISLTTGANTISFTVFDAARRTASQTVVVTKTAPPPATSGGAPVSISITSPAGTVITTSQPTLNVTGTSSGAAGITRIAWQTATGASGTAVGTERWSATAIPLLTGTNTLVIRAYDAKGTSAWVSLVIVRR